MIYKKQQGYHLDEEVLERAGTSEEGDFKHTRTKVPMEDANLVSSETKHLVGMHKPLLDLDVRAELIPSRTPGHYHLYINAPMSWEQYEKLLKVMAEVGILELNYVNASIERKATMLRKPGTFTPHTEVTF